MFILKYFYKCLSLLAFCYYFVTSNILSSLMCLLINPFKISKNLHNDIVNNKSTLFLTLINNWKKPNHLVLIIGEDVILYNDITQIILWCMIAGISFVSIYDYKNRLSHLELLKALKNNPLFEELNKLTLGFSFKKATSKVKAPHDTLVSNQNAQNGKLNGIANKYYGDDDSHRILTIIEDKTQLNIRNKHLKNEINNNDSPFKGSNGDTIYCYGNGKFDASQQKAFEKMFSKSNLYLDHEKTELNILTRKQCEKDILDSLVQISKSKNDVSNSVIETELSERCPLTDPEVGIVIGKRLSTYGLLPWNIRLTEFFQFNNHYDINILKFRHILMKYSKCEQRFGK